MNMGQSLGCYQTLAARQSLNHEQKLQLKQLLLLQQTLRHPEYPAIIRGLEGMLTAHSVLQKKQAVGVLIGGLSEAVWNQQCTPDKLTIEHKDVDVMVISPKNNIQKFEGGIDWWFPKKEKIDIIGDYSQKQGVEKQWWQNGNDVILSFGLQQNHNLSPGLYIPDACFVRKMREYEVLANIDENVIQIEYEAIEAFERKMEQRIKTSLPKFIREQFNGYILSDKYEQDHKKTHAIELDQFDLDTVGAIYSAGHN